MHFSTDHFFSFLSPDFDEIDNTSEVASLAPQKLKGHMSFWLFPYICPFVSRL